VDGRIFRLKEQILGNLSHQWTTHEMTGIVRLSERHLQKLFKNETGVSPVTFLRELRLEKARFLLETTFLTMKEIGAAIGMTNTSRFTRDFKKKYGATPTDYRKKFWEKEQAKCQSG
jgi:transcriptional regulator GlxA family with amidase domain